MTTKQKPRNAASTGAAKNQSDELHFTRNADPLIGWFELGKLARMRQMKKSWLRKSRGAA